MNEEISIEQFIHAIEQLLPAYEQRQWIRWLSEYHTPGYYNRQVSKKRSAKFAYNHLANPEMLLWLARAAGVEKQLVQLAESESRDLINVHQQVAAIRRHVPWVIVNRALCNLKSFDEIQDYVQYHNSEKVDFSCLELEYKKGFRVSTSKSVPHLIGNRVWLIGGLGKNPREYYLCNYFIVDKVGPTKHRSLFKYAVEGQTGVAFQPPIPLNNVGWFDDFLQRQQNFHWGLRKLDKTDVAKFEKLIGNLQIPTGIEKQSVNTSVSFGNPETNRKIEQAAISQVTKYYEENGWSVESVERLRIGFDLLCIKGSREEHVEVKGTQGSVETFVITPNEVAQSESDMQFVLYIVTSALSNQPKLKRYTAKEFNQKFELEPVAYFAALK